MSISLADDLSAQSTRQAKMRSRSLREAMANWLLVVPALLLMLLIYFTPLARVLVMSVTEPTLGFGNYELLVTDPAVRRVLATTLRVALVTTAVSIVIAYVVAYGVSRVQPRHRRMMMMFILLPFWVSALVRAFTWATLLGREGLVNKALLAIGIISEPLSIMYTEFAVDLGMVHYMVPVATLTLYANMVGMDTSLMSAARGLGASPWRAFWRIFFPMSLPGVAAASILVFVFSMGFFVTPALLGGGKTIMAAQYIYTLVNDIVQWGVATMLATSLLVIIIVLLGALSLVFDMRRLFGAR